MQLCRVALLKASGVLRSIKHMLRLPHAQASSMVEGFAQGLFERMAGSNGDGSKVSTYVEFTSQPAEGRQ